MTYKFYSNCVNWPEPAYLDGGLSDMCDQGQQITRRTFMKHVDHDDLRQQEQECGYDVPKNRNGIGFMMSADWHVTYHRSTLHGERVYYYTWSGIEYVFTQKKTTSCPSTSTTGCTTRPGQMNQENGSGCPSKPVGLQNVWSEHVLPAQLSTIGKTAGPC